MNFRGVWNAVTNYAVNDAVTFAGSTYLAQMQGSNAEPDVSAQSWAVLAQSGGAGPTGAQGQAASVQVGTVTTLAAGIPATVTNVGTAQAAVLNFGIPQGAAGASGTGGGTGGSAVSGSYAAVYHAVSYNTKFYSVNLANASAGETDGSVLAWVPLGCTATRMDVYSQQSGAIKVTLRQGMPGAMADTALVCSAATNGSCTVSGSVAVGAGSFLDMRIDFASGTTAGVWTSVQCQ
jgi:collagen type VII alpha